MPTRYVRIRDLLHREERIERNEGLFCLAHIDGAGPVDIEPNAAAGMIMPVRIERGPSAPAGLDSSRAMKPL
ncbi:MAG: hypothetical protein OXO48_13065 [Caldilineaceae bacterium]|nr:hypothetical protein [Caldilineaceae bacterium]